MKLKLLDAMTDAVLFGETLSDFLKANWGELVAYGKSLKCGDIKALWERARQIAFALMCL